MRFEAACEKLEDRLMLAAVTFSMPSTNGGDGTWVLEQREGVNVHVGPAYLYYNVNPAVSFPDFQPGDTLYLKVDYFDEGSRTLEVQYDSLYSNFDRTEFHSHSSVLDTHQFLSSYHVLENAEFANGGNGNDFRVIAFGVPISTVELSDQRFPESRLEWVADPPWHSRYVGPSRDDADASTLDGKIMTGYQGWFNTPNDLNDSGYRHWGQPGNWNIDQWPDPNDYDVSELFAVPNYSTASGAQAYLFSSSEPKAVERHFQWMREHNIDGVLLQRFPGAFMNKNPDGTYSGPNQWPLVNVRDAAHREGRTWAVEYDISQALSGDAAAKDAMIQKVKNDWEFLTDPDGPDIANDSRYQREDGKPVVTVYGLYLNSSLAFSDAQQADLINYFQSRGMYVVGAGRHNGSSAQTANAGLHDAYIPWQGYWSSGNSFAPAEALFDGVTEHIPHVFPGFSWTHLKNDDQATSRDREDGAFYWRMLSDAVNETDAPWLFIGMFDEYDEATNLIPASDDPPVPDTDADGDQLTFQISDPSPNDWWMALTGAAKEALLGKVAIDGALPAEADLENRSNVGGEVRWQTLDSDRLMLVDLPDGQVETTQVTQNGQTFYASYSPDPYLHFQIDDAFLFEEPDGRDVTIEVEYLDSATDSFRLQYDSINEAHELSLPAQLTGSGKWRTHRFELSDGSFANRQDGGADFRIEKAGGTLLIRRVRVIKESMLSVEVNLAAANAENGLMQVDVADGLTQSTTSGGRDARMLSGTALSQSMYFRIDDEFAAGIHAGLNALVEVIYQDLGTGNLNIEYDSTKGANLASDAVPLQNTEQWRTARFYVDDAFFGNRQEGGADFRIKAANVPIDRVRVLRSFGDLKAPELATPSVTVSGVSNSAIVAWSMSDDWITGQADQWTAMEDGRVRIEWSNDGGTSWNPAGDVYLHTGGTSQAGYDVATGRSTWTGEYVWDTSVLSSGMFLVRLTPTDGRGNEGASIESGEFELTVVGRSATIVDRQTFYNNSAFDGIGDGNAIAVDKTALLAGNSATTANYTSYIRGINGVMVDIRDAANPQAIDLSDFEFHVGNSLELQTWPAGPSPSVIDVRELGGGVSRVTLIWPDRSIVGEWLKVTVNSTTRTGLPADDVFYWGNAPGETGNSSTDALVNATDFQATRANPANFLYPAAIDSPYDFNRDGRVNATDLLIVRDSATSMANSLQLISVPASFHESNEILIFEKSSITEERETPSADKPLAVVERKSLDGDAIDRLLASTTAVADKDEELRLNSGLDDEDVMVHDLEAALDELFRAR